MKLIDLDEFLRQNCVDRMDGKSCEECKYHVLAVSCERLMEQPTAERVGKWERKWHTLFRCELYCCSTCGHFEPFRSNYCSNCGADMRGEEDERPC